MKLKYLDKNYEPKGDLEGFPLEVIDKMLEYQVEQGNEADTEVFEENNRSGKSYRGFDWVKTKEGFDFWDMVIYYDEFDIFFEKYPERLNSNKLNLKIC